VSVKITVITPSYNQGRFLEETLRSVLAQRDLIHEYFVIDGGSSDNSADLIRRYAAGIDYWVSEKDRGQSDAIQKGFARATGEVLFWLNSDDVLLPGALARVHAAFDQNPQWDVLTGYSLWIDADSRVLKMHRMPAEKPFWIRGDIWHVCQQTCYFKRSLYEKVGGVRLDFHCAMDGELWVRMFLAGATWGHVPEYLGAFRRHADAKGSSWLQKYAEEYERLEEMYPRLKKPSLRKTLTRRAYQVSQALSPQRWRAWAQTRRFRGKNVHEVFPDSGAGALSGAPALGAVGQQR
jgi:glycosyltransferase involved in cell wall biosynthesis